MSWFGRGKTPPEKAGRRNVPEGVFIKCEGCDEMLYSADFELAFRVCTKCGKHHSLPANRRIDLLVDQGTFVESDADLRTTDPLKFRDTKKYRDRIKAAEKLSGAKEAIKTGSGRMNGWGVEIAVFEFGFLAGSMGAVVGEKIARSIERAIANKSALVIVSCSGGARMQEGTISLMQMGKTSIMLAALGEAGLPYISVPTHPTTGGVTASFVMLGDVIVAEPNAQIGFAGARVIEQTIRQTLPEGFQRSEFLLEHGFVDYIAKRFELKDTIATMIKQMSAGMSEGNRGK